MNFDSTGSLIDLKTLQNGLARGLGLNLLSVLFIKSNAVTVAVRYILGFQKGV